MYKRTYKGQTLLITVLVLTIALTVVLSLIRRTTMDVRTTGQLEESARAFSAAEAGIEDALKNKVSKTGVTIQSGNGSAIFDTTYTDLTGSSSVFTYASSTAKGEVATIWLAPHDANNILDESGTGSYCAVNEACPIEVCWDQPPLLPSETVAVKPAVEVGILYKKNGAYGVVRFAYDPDTARTGNKFTTASGTGCGGMYSQAVTFPAGSGLPLALRLRPYYNQTTFSVSPSAGRTLPPQGFVVSSTGKTETGVTRKIVVKRNYDSPASIFDFVLYSNTTISNEAY